LLQIIKKACRLPEYANVPLFFVIFALVTLNGCNIKQEGCLDIAAENFDLDADKPCDGCCTYPSVSLSLSQKWNDENFNRDTSVTYPDKDGQHYKIIDLRYLLSSFVWIDENGENYTIDSSEIACNSETIRYTHDLIVVDPKKFVYVLDTFRLSPAIRSLHLKVGWQDELQCVDETGDDVPSEFSDASPLWDTLADSRAAIRIILQRNLSVRQFDTLYLHTCHEIQLPYEFDFVPGKDTQLNITVNYALWFQNADVDDLNSFSSSVVENIAGSFSRTP
jgi:hypothetical protein